MTDRQIQTFTELVNLASRLLGAGVVATNEDTFADAEHLLLAEPAEFRPHTFGLKGQIMDGWESRRRRGRSAEQPHPTDEDHDWAIVRLGAAGRIHGVIVDTAHFTGNYPESGSVQAASIPGHPSPEEVAAAAWTDLVPRTPLRGDTAHEFAVTDPTRYTHVRLNIWPDGGVARLRVHGEVLPDPRDLAGLTFDLAAQEHGGVAEAASDRYFSSPHNLNAPGRATVMGEGWRPGVGATRPTTGCGSPWPGAVRSWPSKWTPATSSPTPRLGRPAGVRRHRRRRSGHRPRGLVRDPAAHPTAARHPAPAAAVRRPPRHPCAAGRLPGRRHRPAAPHRPAHRGRAGEPGPALVQRAARRRGHRGAGRGRAHRRRGRRPDRSPPTDRRRRPPGRTAGRLIRLPVGSR